MEYLKRKGLKLKRLLSLMLVFSLMVTAAPDVYADDEETQANLIGTETVWYKNKIVANKKIKGNYNDKG